MNVTLLAILGVLCIVVVTVFSKRLGLAAPLALVVAGIVLSFVPGTPDVEVDPEVILAGVLPPLLYSSAVNMPSQDFRRNLKVINSLAVVLVVLTTLATGWLVHLLVPGIGWAAAFALGAVVSPTDAVAATSIGKRLGLPPRVLTMLEGEGLVNDASSLVLLRSATAAISASVSLWGVAGSFVRSVLLAVLIGWLVGQAAVWVRARLRDPVLSTAISFIVPFVGFLPAEELQASGVLAVVMSGLVVGREGPRRIPARDRWVEAMNWRTIAFLMESGIFLLMGLSLKPLLDVVPRSDVAAAFWVGLAVSALVMVLRLAYVVPLVAGVRQDQRRAAETRDDFANWEQSPRFAGKQLSDRKRQNITQRVDRALADIDFKLTEAIGWRSAAVLGWSGMRGAITVAAAQTLPEDTPHRAELVMIAYLVAVVTLLVQGLTLPVVIRRVGITDDSQERLKQQEQQIVAAVWAAGSRELDRLAAAEDPPERELVDLVRDNLDRESSAVASRAASADDVQERADFTELRLRVLAAQRRELGDLEDSGGYASQAIRDATGVLDRFEWRLSIEGGD